MTCPSCSRSTRDYTNSSGLVARCDAPYHAAADLCGTPNAHHPGCPVFRNLACDCGAAKALPDASKDSHSWQPPTPERIDALRIAESLANARPLEPAQNGFRWCHDCESVQPAAGHECRDLAGQDADDYLHWLETGESPAMRRADMAVKMGGRAVALWREARERAEFAESLLCAMAFDSARSNPKFGCNVGLFHHDEDECAMCTAFYGAARGGGR